MFSIREKANAVVKFFENWVLQGNSNRKNVESEISSCYHAKSAYGQVYS